MSWVLSLLVCYVIWPFVRAAVHFEGWLIMNKEWILHPGSCRFSCISFFSPFHSDIARRYHPKTFCENVNYWYLLRSMSYLYAGLVTFTQPPTYLFSSFCCRQSCLTGLSGEYNLPCQMPFKVSLLLSSSLSFVYLKCDSISVILLNLLNYSVFFLTQYQLFYLTWLNSDLS